jgi:hypothetical protein
MAPSQSRDRGQLVSAAMSQVLDFTGFVKPQKVRLRVVPRGDEVDDFWAAISPSSWVEEEPAPDPANAPRQVLSEVFALFAVVGGLIFAVALFVPGPSF